ncbi:MAG: hypothetical protein DI529_05370 [Chryseobacterium sp.]|nr:MAG: hypothetical protein DI529_05370 [Chryseobacterium sp.]
MSELPKQKNQIEATALKSEEHKSFINGFKFFQKQNDKLKADFQDIIDRSYNDKLEELIKNACSTSLKEELTSLTTFITEKTKRNWWKEIGVGIIIGVVSSFVFGVILYYATKMDNPLKNQEIAEMRRTQERLFLKNYELTKKIDSLTNKKK